MKIPLASVVFIAVIQLFTIGTSSAQSKTGIATLQPPPPKIVIDGDIKEWGDSLRYFNAEKQINYAIANSKDTLYLAIRVNDRSEQTRILKAGITFSIDPRGKKKENYSLTYPLNLNGNPPAPLAGADQDAIAPITQQQRDELQQELLTNLRGIKVEGFKDIEGDMITTSNTYGIRAAIDYDDKDYLVCEMAIPLSFFHADANAKNEWAFNFKINGIQRPAPKQDASSDDNSQQSSGRGGRGGGGGRGGRGGKTSHAATDDGNGELSKSVDFWEKYYLAK